METKSFIKLFVLSDLKCEWECENHSKLELNSRRNPCEIVINVQNT